MVNERKNLKVALAGNSNSGKTSVCNQLTGANPHVGNYAGVTVERRSGRYRWDGQQVDVLDLPGTYSLSSRSPEERITRDELLQPDLDVVVVVVDSTTLKRSLVFLSQVMQIGVQPVLCLNMSDEAQRAGQRLDLGQMERLLGFPVVESVGHKGKGIDELKRAIADTAIHPRAARRAALGDALNGAVDEVVSVLRRSKDDFGAAQWVATRLILDDAFFVGSLKKKGEAGDAAIKVATERREQLERDTGVDISLYVMQCYYGFVDGLLKEVMTQAPAEDARRISDAVDAVLVNRFIGIPVFPGVMYAIFGGTFTVGDYPMGWIETGFEWLEDWVSGFFSDDSVVRSLIVDGVIGGEGGVVVFLPNIVLLFLGLALLEDTGYMSRAAFLVDRFMHRFGLHGKSFIPMMTGFGCSIPGIMATRAMENETDRLTTMLVLPLMSCGARLPIWMLLVPVFFAVNRRAGALFGIYMVGIFDFVAGFSGWKPVLLRRM
ncbi:MAG: ferrous iron transport protein B [Deltaproteobacteria bacterium]|nr:ferrous iron transport protein B [Deltaproteobacteria bacterium]